MGATWRPVDRHAFLGPYERADGNDLSASGHRNGALGHERKLWAHVVTSHGCEEAETLQVIDLDGGPGGI
jgi:hypothetical protein